MRDPYTASSCLMEVADDSYSILRKSKLVGRRFCTHELNLLWSGQGASQKGLPRTGYRLQPGRLAQGSPAGLFAEDRALGYRQPTAASA